MKVTGLYRYFSGMSYGSQRLRGEGEKEERVLLIDFSG
jgi:hypothetical protein